MSFDRIVGYIGIAALFLAIPMAVLANMITPKVQTWWSDRNYASLQLEIRCLDTSLETSALVPHFSRIEWVVYQTVYRNGVMIGLAIHGFSGIVFLLLWYYLEPLARLKPHELRHVLMFSFDDAYVRPGLLMFMAAILDIANFHNFWRQRRGYEHNRTLHTDKGREASEFRLASLKARLASFPKDE